MNLSNTLLQAFMLLNQFSSDNYLVGGCVRDSLLGKIPKDYDIVTDVHMDIIEDTFQSNGWKVDAVGKQFLVLAVHKNGEIFEIANFRKDGTSTDGRRPDTVEIGSIFEDFSRRDFTVNGIYYNPLKDEYKHYSTSLKDVQNNILKFIGKPKDRIKEDYLRVFRFYRFVNTKGLIADPKSLKACRTHFNEAYKNTTPERVRNEIERMM